MFLCRKYHITMVLLSLFSVISPRQASYRTSQRWAVGTWSCGHETPRSRTAAGPTSFEGCKNRDTNTGIYFHCIYIHIYIQYTQEKTISYLCVYLAIVMCVWGMILNWYVYVYTYIYIYVGTCIYIYTYIYIFICIHMHICARITVSSLSWLKECDKLWQTGITRSLSAMVGDCWPTYCLNT